VGWGHSRGYGSRRPTGWCKRSESAQTEHQ